MRVGILYICTGIYVNFWKEFFISSEKYFLPGIEKNYYVFTDSDNIYQEQNPHVFRIFQKNLGWPGNTLFRFRIFSKNMNMFCDMDYLYFLNANMLFESTVGKEVMPSDKLLVVKHPGYWGEIKNNFPYDRNQQSTAYIPMGHGDYYVMGGFNGGPAQVYIKMILDLEQNIDIDCKNNVTARWHDESHLNKYILTHPYTILSPAYARPQGWIRFPFQHKAMIRDKVMSGGRIFIKQKHWSNRQQIRYYISYFLNCIRKH